MNTENIEKLAESIDLAFRTINTHSEGIKEATRNLEQWYEVYHTEILGNALQCVKMMKWNLESLERELKEALNNEKS